MLTRRLIQLLITLCLIVVLTAVGLMLFVDPNRYKEVITSRIEEKIHRPVTIEGDINWRFWPSIGFGVEKVKIGEPNSTKILADIAQINLYAQIMPLFNKQIEVSNLKVENATVYLPKKIELNIASLDTALHIDVQSKRYEASDGNVDMSVSGLDGFSQAQPVTLTFKKLLMDLNADQITADHLKADIFGGQLFVNASADHFSKNPKLQGTLSATNLNPRHIAQAFGKPIHSSDKTLFNKLDLDATFKDTDTGFIIQPLKAQLDHTQITGNLNINNIHPLKAQGDLLLDTLTLSDLTFSQTQVHINANNDIIHFAPLKTHVFSGTLETTTVLNMQSATPHWNIDATLNNMLVNTPKFSGHLNAQTKLTANGFDSETMIKTLNGTARGDVKDGMLNNLDLNYWFAVGDAMLLSAKDLTTLAINTAQAAAGKTNTHHTAFTQMTGTFNVQQGIAHNNDMKVVSDTIAAQGKGTIDLPKQYIDYSVLVGRTQAGSVQIPVKITGNFSNPNVGIDSAGIQKILLQGVGTGIAIGLTGGVVPAVGAGEAIIDSVTGNNAASNAATKPEEAVKDALKGLFGK